MRHIHHVQALVMKRDLHELAVRHDPISRHLFDSVCIARASMMYYAHCELLVKGS
jgi:hypothetical protein